ncbi:TrkA family potassium uptake protein [Synechococcus sp. PCC 6312]|uniref:potassium channel family protein n=1 Tax=Synechococcus sp. (strain ATCC 27167 / PCC 6312) TaxID=195253 RepID=UPI00029F0962|nr:NAD-binding protein [Synechococcus sp. PCC 6312]AFY62047.1 K+ transport system, NAD-binding component [Synechococcus sp. PCC 6312]
MFRPRWQFLLVAIVGLGLVGLVGLLLWTEGATSQDQAWELLENVIITLLGEYPDRPKTLTGQVLQLLLFIFGTFVFGAVIGRVSSFFVMRSLQRKTIMKQFQDHIIICNWNLKAVAILQQLIEANKQHQREIVIISTADVKLPEDLQTRSDIYLIQADPTHHATLAKYGATQAKSVILLADEDSESPDAKNALIALAIKHLEEAPGLEQHIHVVAELVNLDRQRHLKEAGVDEIISAREYSSGIIAQSALFKNMSVVYQQLLTYSEDTNEFYFIDPDRYPSQLIGKTFEELSQWINQYSRKHPENPVLLLGVKRGNGEILLNPRHSSFQHLEAQDSLIVMAFKNVTRLS